MLTNATATSVDVDTYCTLSLLHVYALPVYHYGRHYYLLPILSVLIQLEG